MGRERANPPTDAAQSMSRLDFRGPPGSEEPVIEAPASAQGVTEAPPRGAPEWLRSAMEAERVRRETAAREAKEAEERASAEARRRIEELTSRIQEHHSFKQKFAEAEQRLERRLGQVEERVQTAERRAAWAKRVAAGDGSNLPSDRSRNVSG